ncbi:MAG: hypothetical protein ACI4KA_06425 [Oscillospiraceae bacterium]
MSKLSINLRVDFHHDMYERYRESTSYTANSTFTGDINITPTTNYSFSGFYFTRKYNVIGAINYSTDKAIKYVRTSLLFCNRVGDPVKKKDYEFMGPYTGSGSLDLGYVLDCGNTSSAENPEYLYAKINKASVIYMDGTSEDFSADYSVEVNVCRVITPKEREREEYAQMEISGWMIFLCLIIPILGLVYGIYLLIKGAKKPGMIYLIIGVLLLVFMFFYVLVT